MKVMLKYYLIKPFNFIYSNFYESKYFSKFEGKTILIINSIFHGAPISSNTANKCGAHGESYSLLLYNLNNL